MRQVSRTRPKSSTQDTPQQLGRGQGRRETNAPRGAAEHIHQLDTAQLRSNFWKSALHLHSPPPLCSHCYVPQASIPKLAPCAGATELQIPGDATSSSPHLARQPERQPCIEPVCSLGGPALIENSTPAVPRAHALPMSSLPSDYTNEIRALDREILKNQPKDILQSTLR